jgi:hypothetical protein
MSLLAQSGVRTDREPHNSGLKLRKPRFARLSQLKPGTLGGGGNLGQMTEWRRNQR